MILRPYEKEDHVILAGTFNDPVYCDYWRNCKTPLKRADFENIERLMGMQVLTVEKDGVVVGFLTGQLRTDTTIFCAIIILKEHQGKGCAKEMIVEGLRYLKNQRYHKVAIRVNPENQRLIEKCMVIGFEKEGLFKAERWSVEGWKDELMMSLCLEDYHV